MPLQADNDLDLVAFTLRQLNRHKWTDAVSSKQRFVALQNLMQKNKVHFYNSGYGIQFNIQVNPSGAFQMVGIGSPDRTGIVDQGITANLPWRRFNAFYEIDAQEVAMNRDPSRILDLTHFRRSGCFISIAEGLETQTWTAPTSTTDTLNAFGMPYWIVPNTIDGFNGGNPFGFSAGAGNVNSTTYPTWANYTNGYTDFSKLDMVRKMRKAAHFTDFESPTLAAVPQYNTGDDCKICVPYPVYERFVEISEQQNDNLGKDIAPMDGKNGRIVFHKNEIIWTPALDGLNGQGQGGSTGAFNNSTYASTGGQAVNMIYGINFGVLRPAFLEGWYMREEGPYYKKGIQHTMMAVQIDSVFNVECKDRRKQWILTQ